MKIVILDAKTLGQDVDLSIFQKWGEVSVFQITDRQQVFERIKGQDIVITNKVVFDQEVLEAADQLKLICLTATGTNNVDLVYAKEKGIAVTNVAGYSTQSVTQHTFAMLFYLLEKMKYYDNYVKSNTYTQSDSFTHLDESFWEIGGKRWGIIGLGAIGKEVAKIAKAFGAEVVYYSTSGQNTNQEYERASLEELLRRSDIVSIHAPLNEKTKGLIQYNQLRLMKKSSILINVGRGGIVDEVDLAKALDEKTIGGAALDVLEVEPIKEDNPLLRINDKDRLLITPHVAWASVEARRKLMDEVFLNIEYFLKNEKRNRVV